VGRNSTEAVSDPVIPFARNARVRRWLLPLFTAVSNASLRAITLASKLALTVAVARLLGPEDLGLFGLVASAVALSVFALGFEYHYFTIRQLVPLNAVERAAMIRDQVALHLLTLGAALPVGIWLAFNPQLDLLPARVIGWYLLLVPIELMANELGIVLVALERPVLSNVVLFLRSAGWVYIVIPLIAVQSDRGRALDWLFRGWWIGGAISIGFAAYALRDLDWSAALPRPIDWQRLRHGVRVAVPFVVTSGASLGMLFVDRFIIEHHLGLVAVGIYTFFASLTTGMHTLIYSAVSLLRMPRLVLAHRRDDQVSFHRELKVMTVLTLGALGALALVLLGGIHPMLALVGRNAYSGSLNVFYLLLSAAACRAMADIPIYALYSRHRDGYLAAVNAAGFIASIAVNLLLIPRLGLPGAAIAALTGSVVLLGLATLALRLPAIPAADVLGWAQVVPPQETSHRSEFP
jgi:O-antigen/teichoic acid export membrane protein